MHGSINNNPVQLKDLFTVLPYEILCTIFGHLGWSDLILCMSVHPSWNALVPQFAKKKLSTFEFRPGSLSEAFYVNSLGPHVETITLHQLIDNNDYVNDVLETVIRKGCTVKRLKFSECRIFDLEKFLLLISKFQRTLTELTFELHRDQMPYRHIIAACPNLTHFACDLEDVTYEPTITMQPTLTNTSITYLSVNILLQRDDRLLPILRLCPELRCLVLGYAFFVRDGDPHRWPRPIDLDDIMELCPQLEYFQCNAWENEPEWVMHAANRTPSSGLREFITDHVGIYDSRQILPLLLKSQETLEALKIGRVKRDGRSWLHGFTPADFYAPRLHTLKLRSIESGDPRQVGALIRQCPALQKVSLHGRMASEETLDALTTCRNTLRRLSLDTPTTSDLSVIHAFKNLIKHNTTIQSIRLTRIDAINDTALAAIASVSSLEEIQLSDLPLITRHGMEQFATLIQNSRALKTLVVKDMQVVTETTLRALSCSTSLHTLELCRCGNLAEEGLLEFTDKAKYIEKLCIDCCIVPHAAVVQIRKRFGKGSIRCAPEHWPYV
ncbi:hypothetical protein BJV82DRAFT_622479 [Fennellomyces sp. T-0311]|nr:hypothetical protein BJV82DRAFT_622479 [Fennellomyces sp. T-0311]